jgi:ABC-2 type transport system permease protein
MEAQTRASFGRRIFGLSGRTVAVMRKEFLMLRRDHVTAASMVVIPVALMLLHGYALDNTPRNLRTAWVAPEESDVAFELRSAIEQTGFFRVTRYAQTIEQADDWFKSGEVTFVVEIPAGFERRLRRGEYPAVLISADATDPVAMSIAIGSLEGAKATVLTRIRGPAKATDKSTDFELRVHRRYNPAGVTRLHIVPGLLGIILSISMLYFTALTVTREYERGTIEGLLATPVRPVEIMFGKLAPYVLGGAGEAVLIVAVAVFVLRVPIVGSLMLLAATTMLFIMTNLAIGYTFSTVSQNESQAIHLTNMFFCRAFCSPALYFRFRECPLGRRT